MTLVGYTGSEGNGMATSSFDKTIVIKDDKAADVLIQAAKSDLPRPATHPSTYRLVAKETLVKKSVMR